MGNPRKVQLGKKTSDYYKAYRKDGGIVKRDLYYKILTEYCQSLHDDLLAYREITLPQRFGKIRIIKFMPKLEVTEDGKIETNMLVNTKATNELWEKDPEAKEKKILVRFRNTHSNGYTFSIHWYKGKMVNIGVLKFKSNRNLKRELSRRIIEENYDAFIS